MVSTYKGEEVRHVWHSQPKVRLWDLCPFLMQRYAIPPNDGKVGLKAGIEPCGTDDSIHLGHLAILPHQTRLRDLHNFSEVAGDIGLLNSHDIRITRRDAPTPQRPIGSYLCGKLLILKHVLGPLSEILRRRFLHLRTFLDYTKNAINTTL